MYRKSIGKKKKKIFKALALSRKILLSLVEYDGPDATDYAFGWRTWTREDRKYAEAAQMRRALYNLKNRKFIEIRTKGDKVLFVLTDKGRVAALKERIRLAGDRKDGKLLLVSFDIPEQESYVRDKIRYLLKDLKFEKLQFSLWASKQDVGPLLVKLVKDMGAQKWVKIFVSKEMN